MNERSIGNFIFVNVGGIEEVAAPLKPKLKRKSPRRKSPKRKRKKRKEVKRRKEAKAKEALKKKPKLKKVKKAKVVSEGSAPTGAYTIFLLF